MRSQEEKGIKCRASYRVNDEAVIGICAAILIRHQNPQMNLLQRLISMILYNGHAPKMVMEYIIIELISIRIKSSELTINRYDSIRILEGKNVIRNTSS